MKTELTIAVILSLYRPYVNKEKILAAMPPTIILKTCNGKTTFSVCPID
jgi:hypothetical protein